MNLSKIVLASLGVLFVTGCGGGGSGSAVDSKWESKTVIVILKDIPSGICQSAEFRDSVSEEYTGVITEEKPNNTVCEDYGRKNDQETCGIIYYEGSPKGNVACVIGIDGVRDGQSSKKIGVTSFKDDIHTKFIQLSD